MIEVSSAFVNSFYGVPSFATPSRVWAAIGKSSMRFSDEDPFFQLAIRGLSVGGMDYRLQICCFGEALMHPVSSIAQVGGAIGRMEAVDRRCCSCQPTAGSDSIQVTVGNGAAGTPPWGSDLPESPRLSEHGILIHPSGSAIRMSEKAIP